MDLIQCNELVSKFTPPELGDFKSYLNIEMLFYLEMEARK